MKLLLTAILGTLLPLFSQAQTVPFASPGENAKPPAYSPIGARESVPRLASNGHGSLLAWLDARAGIPQVYYSAVSPSGDVLQHEGTPASQLANGAQNLAAAGNGSNYFLIWEAVNTSQATIYGIRIANDGTPLDANPIQIAKSSVNAALLPAVASDGTDYLITWQQRAADGKDDILARRVLADGTMPEASPLTIASGPAEQYSPTVAGLPGGYLLAWIEFAGSAQTNANVLATRIDSSGTRLDATNFPVTSSPSGYYQPAAAASKTGFLVTWLQSNPGGGHTDVAAARIGLTGNLIDRPPLPLQVDFDSETQVTATSDGENFLVLWQQDPLTQLPPYSDIRGSLVHANGQIEPVNSATLKQSSLIESSPAVVFDGHAYELVWQRTSPGSPPYLTGYRLTPDLKPAALSARFLVGRENRQSIHAAVATPAGYLMAWYDNQIGTSTRNAIITTRTTPAGQPRFSPGIIDLRPYPPIHLALAASGDTVLLVWLEQNTGTGQIKTYSQIIGTNGWPASSPLPLSLPNGGTTALQVAAGTNGWMLVDQVRMTNGGGVSAQIRAFCLAPDGSLADPAGTLLSPARNPYTPGSPSIAFNGTNYLVIWSDGSPSAAIYGARVSADGSVIDPGGRLISYASGFPKGSPSVATDGTNFFAAWQQKDQNATTYAIQGTLITSDFGIASTDGLILGTGSGPQFPSVASDGSHYLIAWDQEHLASSETIYYLAHALAAPDGTIVRTQRQLLPNESASEIKPLALGGNGSFMIAYLWQTILGDSRVRQLRVADTVPLFEPGAALDAIVAGSAPALIVPNGLFFDAFDATFDNGSINAALDPSSPAGIQLAFLPDSTPGSEITLQDGKIGILNAIVGDLVQDGTSLTIHFTAPLAPILVQDIVRRIAIQASPVAPGTDLPPAIVNLAITNPMGQSTPPVQISIPIATPPEMASLPTEIAATAGTAVRLQSAASGGALNFTWLFDGIPFGGAPRSDLSLGTILPSQAGDYSVVASNAAGSATNLIAHVTVLPDTPVITVPPLTHDAASGDTTFFRVEASANLLLSYQWQHDGTNLPGAISPFLRLNPGAAFGGDYQVIISNASASITSAPAALRLYPLTHPPQLLWARTWGNNSAVVLGFDSPPVVNSVLQSLSFEIQPAGQILRTIPDPADARQITLAVSGLAENTNYLILATEIATNSLLGRTITNVVSIPIDRHIVNQSLLGATVPGFQDDFASDERDGRWTPSGTGGDVYEQHDGMLSIAAADGDPNHLLFVSPAYDPDVQDVLARVHVTSMDVGDGPRAGVVVSANLRTSQGVNLLARQEIPGVHSFEMLNDLTAWAPGPTNIWTTNQWYWMRLHRHRAGGSLNVNTAAKVWPADGAMPEPAIWAAWNYALPSTTPIPITAFAGLAGNSGGGAAQMDVDYVLITAEGLPPTEVSPGAFIPHLQFAGLGSDGSIKLQVSGLAGAIALVQYSPDLSTWSDLDSMTLGDTSAGVADPTPPAEGSRFYRVLIQ